MPTSLYDNTAAPEPSSIDDVSGQVGGNRSYAGYEYQIEVTVWSGLDLMLSKAVTDAIVIEGSNRCHSDRAALP